MKKNKLLFVIALLLSFNLTACSGNANNSGAEQDRGKQSAKISKQTDSGENVLIAYFTYGENADLPDDIDASSSASIVFLGDEITGNTGLFANFIQEATGGDLFSIITVDKYPADYDATVDQGQEEKKDDARPKLATHIKNLDNYDIIFLGYPNWWYDMPMPVYTFLDEYDFSGKTIIPFCTSGGSTFSDSIESIKSEEPAATVLEGYHVGGASVSNAKEGVNSWLQEVGFGEE